ncbi:phage holin family protein [Actinomadura barringtoniae]|uniref:Phage holin family protein n=1 Tax=Actinomadura barringtoniae TaxID=1427535 RepID=A0A939T273_9ACTN|nr:phage holin family protein [Actinomadura barringtoniae]MBO2449091.1 phage holin family protein [Actinomadura barringtoniae]
MTERLSGDLAGAPTSELVKQLSEQSARLVREEMRLAQLELKQKGGRAAKGAKLYGGAGVTALYGGGALVAAIVAALALALPTWAAAIIVSAVLFVVAAVLAQRGKKEMALATPPKPEQSAESVRADVQEIKEEVKSKGGSTKAKDGVKDEATAKAKGGSVR